MQCVGSTKKLHAARCRYTIDNPTERAAIHATLEGLAIRRPADVSRNELRRLAIACLCSEHHRGSQFPAVTDKWFAIVRRAALHHDSLLEVEKERLRIELQQEQQQTPPPSYSATQAQGQDQGTNTLSTQLEIVQAWSRLEELQKTHAQLRALMSAAEVENAELRRQLAEGAEKADRERADADARAAALKGDKAALAARLYAAQAELKGVRGEMDRRLATDAAELSAAKSSLEELESELRENKEALRCVTEQAAAEIGDLCSLHNKTAKALKDVRAGKDEELQRLTAEAASTAEELWKAQTDLHTSEMLCRTTEEAAAAETDRLCRAHDAEVKALKDVYAGKDKEVQYLTAEAVLTVEELRKTRADLNASKVSLGELKSELRESKEASRRSTADTGAEIAGLRSAHDAAVKALEDAHNGELQRLTTEAASTAEELVKAQAETAATQTQITRLEAANERLLADYVAAAGKHAVDMLDLAGRMEADRQALERRPDGLPRAPRRPRPFSQAVATSARPRRSALMRRS